MRADDAFAQRGTNLGRRAWLVPLLLFMAYAVYLLVAQRVLLFGHFMLPLGDNATDDLLIFDAKRLRLLHGNYSRFGFYHPGPWFLDVAAFGEWVFYDEAGLFRSYVGAQTFALSLTHGVAFAFCCRLWLLVTGRTSLALLATVVIAAVIAAPLSPANPFVQLWTPYSTIAASLLAATGLAGCVLRGPSWLPLLVLGGAQMVHGHASFLGIVPMILVLALLLAAGLRRLPRPSSRPAAMAWIARNRIHLGSSLAIAALYALPLILHTVLHWPGELRKYWDFLGALPPQPVAAAWRYAIAFLPLDGLWILLFLLPPGAHRQANDLRAAGIVVFVAACIPAFWYSWREVDNVANRYLLLWVTPFIGTALVTGLFYVLRTTVLNRGWRVLPCLLAACLALNSLRHVEPWLVTDQARNLALQRAIDRMLARPPPPDGGRIELFVDPMPAAWVAAWIETATVLAAFRRAGRRDFCVSPETWNIVFGENARCDLGHDRITDRLVITTWAGIASPGAFRLDQSGMIRPTGLRPGTMRSMPETITQGLALEPGWSVFQPDGIWTDAAEAKLGFPATALPDHFRITLGGALMAPRDRPQIVHVFDAAGLELGTLRGGSGPASVLLNVDRKPGTDRITLTLRVDHPTTPAELGMGRDRRKLGFMLSEISVLP